MSRRGLATAAIGGLIAWGSQPSDALAYCRTSGCEEGQGTRCVPADDDDCGVPLFWPTSCVGYVLQEDASSDIDLDVAREIVGQAFAVWEAAECEGGAVAISAEDLGDVSCDEIGYDSEAKNANVIMFRDDDWPYEGGSNALAITTVTYVVDTGEIRDADMEVNTTDVSFSTSDTNVSVDLLSIMTHEAGHFLGLAHSAVSESTMVIEYPPESLTLRTLDPDDVAGICAIYPPSSTSPCESAPVNGLADACGESIDGGCSCSSPRGPGAGATIFGGLLMTAAAIRSARKRRAR